MSIVIPFKIPDQRSKKHFGTIKIIVGKFNPPHLVFKAKKKLFFGWGLFFRVDFLRGQRYRPHTYIHTERQTSSYFCIQDLATYATNLDLKYCLVIWEINKKSKHFMFFLLFLLAFKLYLSCLRKFQMRTKFQEWLFIFQYGFETD